MTFFLACIPPKTSHHAKRIVRVGRFSRLADTPKLVDAKATLDALLLAHQPAEALAGPVALTLEFAWPWLASHPRKVRALGWVPHTSKPDCDNLAKTLTDRLVALRFIEDDARVCALTVLKGWSHAPGITVRIEPAATAAHLGA